MRSASSIGGKVINIRQIILNLQKAGQLTRCFMFVLLFALVGISIAEGADKAELKKGRYAYVFIKPFKQVNGEIIAVRDSLLIIAERDYTDNRKLLRNIDSLKIIHLRTIQHIKLAKIKPRQAYKIGLAGMGLGIGYGLIDYFSTKPEKRDGLRSAVGIPIGLVVGYIVGIAIDAGNTLPEEIFVPDAIAGLSPLLVEARFRNGEPAEFSRALDEIIFSEK